MTTRDTAKERQGNRPPIMLPDPPKHKPGEMTSFDHLARNGNVHHLVHHLGNPETTIVVGERYLLSAPGVPRTEWRIPDMLIAFNADPQLYRQNNACIVSEQGKPPDFVMEAASRGTGRRDATAKREDYLAMGIPEYWRFDETGNYHGARLGGDQLVEGEYRPFPIETLADDVLQGYSPALNLYIRWDHADLRWIDPATGKHIPTFEQMQARVRELEAELARRNGQA